MANLSGFSGQEVTAILQKHFGFLFISQKGSHIKLRKTENSKTITAIVPDHKELAPGALRGVLRQAEIQPTDFLSKN